MTLADQVSTQMDICDLRQYFGCEVLQLFKLPSPIQLEVLTLVKASMYIRQESQRVPRGHSAYLRQRRNLSENKEHQALSETFGTVRAVVTNLSDFWDDQDGVLLEPLLSDLSLDSGQQNGRLTTAAFWLTARISKCYIDFVELYQPCRHA